jgi:hypothetical protein
MTKRVLTHKGTVELHNTTCLDGLIVPVVQATYTIPESTKRVTWTKTDTYKWFTDGSTQDLVCFFPIVKRILVDVGLETCTIVCSNGAVVVK